MDFLKNPGSNKNHPGLPHSLRGLWLESLGEGPQGLLVFLWLMEVIGLKNVT
jgi:hypothetical protein